MGIGDSVGVGTGSEVLNVVDFISRVINTKYGMVGLCTLAHRNSVGFGAIMDGKVERTIGLAFAFDGVHGSGIHDEFIRHVDGLGLAAARVATTKAVGIDSMRTGSGCRHGVGAAHMWGISESDVVNLHRHAVVAAIVEAPSCDIAVRPVLVGRCINSQDVPFAVRNQVARNSLVGISLSTACIGKEYLSTKFRVASSYFIAYLEIFVNVGVERTETRTDIDVIAHVYHSVTAGGGGHEVAVGIHRGSRSNDSIVHRLEILNESGFGASCLGPEDLVIGAGAASGGESHIVTIADILIVSDGGRGGESGKHRHGGRLRNRTLVVVGHHGIGGISCQSGGGKGVDIARLHRRAGGTGSRVPLVRSEGRRGREGGRIATTDRRLGRQLEGTDTTHSLHHLVGIEDIVGAVAEGLVTVFYDVTTSGVAGSSTDAIIPDIIP